MASPSEPEFSRGQKKCNYGFTDSFIYKNQLELLGLLRRQFQLFKVHRHGKYRYRHIHIDITTQSNCIIFLH